MPLRDDIFAARTTAMKERSEQTLSVLRMLVSAITNEEIEKGNQLDDSEVQAVVARQVKQLKDAGKDFATAGRTDLVEGMQNEVKILERFLPEQLSDEEIISIIERVLEQNDDESNFGQVMGKVMQEVNGQADGARVRTLLDQKMNP